MCFFLISKDSPVFLHLTTYLFSRILILHLTALFLGLKYLFWHKPPIDLFQKIPIILLLSLLMYAFCFVLHSSLHSSMIYSSIPISLKHKGGRHPSSFLSFCSNPNNLPFLHYHPLFISLLPPSPLSSLCLSGPSHSSAPWQRSWTHVSVCANVCMLAIDSGS